MNEQRMVTLSTLAQGAAEELFGSAFGEVLENIDDPNMPAGAARSITLTVTIHPNEERRASDVSIECRTKLPGAKGVTTRIFHGRHEGSLAAVEAMPQEEMFPKPQGRPLAVNAPEEE